MTPTQMKHSDESTARARRVALPSLVVSMSNAARYEPA